MNTRRYSMTVIALIITFQLTGGSLALGPQQNGEPWVPSTTEGVDWSGWEGVSELLTDVHARIGIPAIAAAFIMDGKIVAHATVGVQQFGSTEPVGPADRFHLGSVTKSFTGTIIGKLVEEGKLAWKTKIADILGDVEMHDEYRDVTIEQLLHHRGGLPAYTSSPPKQQGELRKYSGTPTERRAAFLADVLKPAPVGKPGQTTLYSNAGYSLAGYLAERITGRSWEQLVEQYVFSPLQMETGGFGFPDQPCGHVGDGPDFTSVPKRAYPPMEIIAPAGNIHCSVSDLARYAIFHLEGLHGHDSILRSETVRRLHTPPLGATEMQYASGWMVKVGPSGEPTHSHGGTVGASYAEIRLYPESGRGSVVLMTVSQTVGETIANKVARAMLERYRPASSENFVTAKNAPEIVVEGKTPSEVDARYWRVVGRLSEAINDEDRDAYHKLFASSGKEPGLSRDEMFDFMARSVLPVRGGVRSFHALSPPIRMTPSKPPARAVIFHLDNGYPGYFAISLNDEDKIDDFSLFIKSDLCSNGPDRQCQKNVKELGKDF